MQRCFDVVSTLRNVVLTLFQCRGLTLYQRCATLKNRRRILFHFRSRINVVSTLIYNVEKSLIWRWNLGWDELHFTLEITSLLFLITRMEIRKRNHKEENYFKVEISAKVNIINPIKVTAKKKLSERFLV